MPQQLWHVSSAYLRGKQANEVPVVSRLVLHHVMAHVVRGHLSDCPLSRAVLMILLLV